MTKKEKARKMLEEYSALGEMNCHWTTTMLAIIDALPDEAAERGKASVWHDTSTGEIKVWQEGWVLESDARKLRIMKAMEEKVACNPTTKFKYAQGTWWWMTACGDSTWENFEPVVPEEPLWEGEIWAHPKEGVPALATMPGDSETMKYGWRRIKVREVR